jgi:hypothetical protein
MRRYARFVASWAAVSLAAESTGAAVALVAAAVSWAAIFPIIMLEACLLGFGQRWILRRQSSGLERGWVAATIGGTLLGRCLQFGADSGVGASIVFSWPVALQIASGVVLGALVGALMAVPQAFVLAGRVRGSWRWVGIRASAWSIALPSLMLAGSWLADASGSGLAALVLAMFATFALVGTLTGFIEGIGLAFLIHRSAGSHDRPSMRTDDLSRCRPSLAVPVIGGPLT